MTNLYILICFVVWIYIQFINKDDKTATAVKLGAFYPPYVKNDYEYWRFITCNFIHIDFFHFIMNAYALYYLGNFFEGGLGLLPYVFLVVISMVFSSMMCLSASYISEKSNYTITLGASGVVYGFFGAIVAMGVLNSGLYGWLFESYSTVIIVNFIYTFMNSRVSKTGHLGGFVGGFLGTVIFMLIGVL